MSGPMCSSIRGFRSRAVGPFFALAFLEFGAEEARLQAAVDDLPGQKRVLAAVAIEVGVGIDAGWRPWPRANRRRSRPQLR